MKQDDAKKAARILVVDDSRDTLEVISRNLKRAGHTVWTASGVLEALSFLETCTLDLVVTDFKMPGVSGLELIRHVRENYGQTATMMITGFGTVQGAVHAIRLGAEDYLCKPFTDEELLEAVDRALEKLALRMSGQVDPAHPVEECFGLIGGSAAMQDVFRLIGKAARAAVTVLINGESGTGKELVARAIHYASPRAKQPFVPINCGAIPEGLIESELFGHVKGSFTGASQTRQGFFQMAGSGTVFLDEIGEMPPGMQVKLLRVLQEKEITMVGEHKPQPVDARIIAATNEDLAVRVNRGFFREDLFYRVNVLTITIPPLRERRDDIAALVAHFSDSFCRELGRDLPVFGNGVMEALQSYDWPGNVRELENMVQRLLLICDGDRIEVTDLPGSMRFNARRGMNGELKSLAENEAEYIAHVLDHCQGNRSQAAAILGIDRKTLRRKMDRQAPEGGLSPL